MNLLEIVNRACTRAKMPYLQSVEDTGSSQAREYLEYANQANEFIMNYWDWRALARDIMVTTVQDQVTIDLPCDFGGFLVNRIYDRTRNLWLENADDDVSLENRAGKYMTDIPFWRVLGKQIVFDFPLEAGRELLIAYKSKWAVITAKSITPTVELFSKDKDTYLLSDQALLAGILYEKSAAYNDTDLETNKTNFLNLLETLKEKDGPNRVINIFGRGANRISPTDFQPYEGA